MTRWSRAARLVRANVPQGGRVLDLGCAFGFGTRGLAGDYRVVGIDLRMEDVRRVPTAFAGRLAGDAQRLPFAPRAFDAVICLEVLEHLPNPAAACAEVARVLRPGGLFVASVPNRGLLAGLDSYNVCSAFFDPGEIVPPGQRHAHFSADDLRALLGPAFALRRVRYSGIGLAELVHYPVVAATRWSARLRPVYNAARFAYFTAALAEDALPAGPWGYNLLVAATRRPS